MGKDTNIYIYTKCADGLKVLEDNSLLSFCFGEKSAMAFDICEYNPYLLYNAQTLPTTIYYYII